MDIFTHHELVQGKDGYSIILHLNTNSTEFSRELIDIDKPEEKTGLLDKPIKEYLKSTFPSLKITSVKVVIGTMLVASFTLSDEFSVKAQANGENDGNGETQQVKAQQLNAIELSGQNRYETSVVISQHGWANGSEAVILGRGDMAIDALTGSVLAKKHQSPLLLTQSDRLPREVEQEIDRLKPKTIYITGGTSAVSSQIENQLKQKGYSVVRINGDSRYDTSVEIAKQLNNNEELILTSGSENSPDALSVAPYAGLSQIPILFTQKDKLPTSVLQYINDKKINKVTIIGGEAAISNQVLDQLKQNGVTSIERVSGPNRYETSVEIANRYRDVYHSGQVFVASGESFIDALPASPLAAMSNAPIILTGKNSIPAAVQGWLTEKDDRISQVAVLGGTGVISTAVRDGLRNKGIIPTPNTSLQLTEFYSVRSGDTLWNISNRYGITVNELKQLNNLTSDQINIGQVLKVPQLDNGHSQTAEQKTLTYTSHTVQSGDNMWDLAIQYGVPMHELLQVNNLTLNSTLSIGQVLTIPVHHIPVKPVVSSKHGELLDWWTEARYVFSTGKTATITDFQTGRTFQVKHTMGGNHADSEPLTAQDAQIMKEIWGGSYSWTPRAIIVEVDGRKLAAAMHSFPHGDQVIRDNNYNGHFCIHFLNSRRHSDDRIQDTMQVQIEIAAGQR
ncbi:cell wall-binding repeat-containing protein [Alkalihalobacillus sp. BA299]|uniref:cell wall-binding repeat-containing protein n=1 Tax=Alkalihalobacillus sp. BA299 TaxID=2815938 RepID=UPI001ADA756B|nr:cell wall-binding repeat-containing protein [Alkalihalobacillus sp. BA299]